MNHLVPRIATIALAVLGTRHARSEVTIVGQSGSYATLQAAVDAAIDGDTLIVEGGFYQQGFTVDDKTLTIVAQNGAAPTVARSCTIRNLAPQRTVAISGLIIQADDSNTSVPNIPGLGIHACQGAVRLEGSSFRGGKKSGFDDPADPGVWITNSDSVVISACTLTGAKFGYSGGAKPGGDGLRSTNSRVALFDCTVVGGSGSDESYPSGGKGGAGCRVEGKDLYLSGCTITGGQGGNGDYIGCSKSGDGGPGLHLTDASTTRLDTSIAGGLAGFYSLCNQYGSPGVPIFSQNSTVTAFPGAARHLAGPVGITDNYVASFTVSGQPGDQVWLLSAPRPGFTFLPSYAALLALPHPFLATWTPQGTIGATGTLIVNVPVGEWTLPTPAQTWFFQALCAEPGGPAFLSAPHQMIVIDL